MFQCISTGVHGKSPQYLHSIREEFHGVYSCRVHKVLSRGVSEKKFTRFPRELSSGMLVGKNPEKFLKELLKESPEESLERIQEICPGGFFKGISSCRTLKRVFVEPSVEVPEEFLKRICEGLSEGQKPVSRKIS